MPTIERPRARRVAPPLLGAAALLGLFFLPSVAHAQEAPRCRAGRALPACSSFWLTEAGFTFRPGTDQEFVPSFEFGLMKNVAARLALGGTAYVMADSGARWGLKPRARLWLTDEIGLDAAASVLALVDRDTGGGFTGHVGVSYRDLVTGVVQWDRFRDGPFEAEMSQVGAGVKIGSKPGIIAGLITAVAGGVLAIVFISGLEN